MIAGLLGAIELCAAGSIPNLTTRIRFANSERKLSLHVVNIWAAAGSQRVDFSLPVDYFTLTPNVVSVEHATASI